MEKSKHDEMEEIKNMRPGPLRDKAMMRVAERLNDSGEWAKHMSPRGALKHLPPLLDDRRMEFGIPDSVFSTEAVFDRIYVYQLPRVFGDLFEGSTLVKPESVRKREEESTPRGVIVSAGLKALDNLLTHGLEVGSIVNFIRLAPWKMTMQEIGGVEINVLVLRDGDITGSEDLVTRRRKGDIRTVEVYCDDSESVEHRLVQDDRKPLKALLPYIDMDY